MDTNARNLAALLVTLLLLGLAALFSIKGVQPNAPTPTRWLTNTPSATPTDTPLWTSSPAFTSTTTEAEPSFTFTPSLAFATETANPSAVSPSATITPDGGASTTPTLTPDPSNTSTPTEAATPTPESAPILVGNPAQARACTQTPDAYCLLTADLTFEEPFVIVTDGVTLDGGGHTITNGLNNLRPVVEVAQAARVTLRNAVVSRSANVALSCCADALSIIYSDRVRVENVTALHGVDGSCDLINSTKVTFKNVICANGLHHSTHEEGAHSDCLLVLRSSDIVILNVLLANCNERLPRVISSEATFGCLVVFNPGTLYGGRVSAEYGPSQVNFYDITFIPGLDSKAGARMLSIASGLTETVFMDAPLLVRSGDIRLLRREPFGVLPNCAPLPLESIGAKNPLTDWVVAGVKDGTGRIIDSPPG